MIGHYTTGLCIRQLPASVLIRNALGRVDRGYESGQYTPSANDPEQLTLTS